MQKIVVLFPPGCGGDFLSWAISIQPGLKPRTIAGITKQNKWKLSKDDIDPDVIPTHGPHDTPVNQWLDLYTDHLFIVIQDPSSLRIRLNAQKNKTHEVVDPKAYAYNTRFAPGPFVEIMFEDLIVSPHTGIDQIRDFLIHHNQPVTDSFKWVYRSWIQSNLA